MFSIVDASDDPTEWFNKLNEADARQIATMTLMLDECLILRTPARNTQELLRKTEGLAENVKKILMDFIRRTPRSKILDHVDPDFLVGLMEGGAFFDDIAVEINKSVKSKSEYRVGETVDNYWDNVLSGLAKTAKSVQVFDSYAHKLIRNGKSLCLERLLAVQGLEVIIHTDVNKTEKIDHWDVDREANRTFQAWQDFLTTYRLPTGRETESRLYLYHPTTSRQHDRRLVFHFDHSKTAISFEAGIEEFEINPLPVPRKPGKSVTQEWIAEQSGAWNSIEKQRRYGNRAWRGVTQISSE